MSKYVSGFCITRHHDTCHKSITYYEKTWVCECECHASAEQGEEDLGTNNQITR